jgi:hypothetical protein
VDAMTVLEFLYRGLKDSRIALTHAEYRKARDDERDNLKKKIAIWEYLIDLTLKEV